MELENIYKPVLLNRDYELLLKYLKMGKNCFEFGSGYSTVWISKLDNIGKIISVENDKIWYDKITELVKKEGVYNIVSIKYVDTDSDGSSWGTPKSQNLIKWKNYYTSYQPEYKSNVIYIDGRFRVSCALDLVCKIDTSTYVFIDDFKNRYYYHVVLKYYDIHDCGKLAVVLVKKHIIDYEKLEKDIELYSTDYN